MALFQKKNKEQDRYYLLPGMGRSNRRFHYRTVWAAVIFGVVVSAIIAVAMWYFSKPGGRL